MKVLIIGGGGREHAILWALKHTASVPVTCFCTPGNGGISSIAQCVALNQTGAIVDFARENNIDLTVVGPEAPLAGGIVDEFQKAGLRIVGPTASAARLESSKVFAKDFMKRHNIPTAEYQVVHSAAEGIKVLRSGRFGNSDSRVVVKADGLAAGKGVVVADSLSEAEAAVNTLFGGSLVPAEAVKSVLLEQALTGREVSVLLFADGRDYKLMPAARDHKRIGENDTGPNTGGMGAITDPSVLDDDTLQRIVGEVIEPTLNGAIVEGFPFRGVLFVGLMLTAEGPQVLEYNVRFGDPETQAILIRLTSGLLEIFEAMVEGKLRNVDVEWSNKSSACVVLASGGYPGAYETGREIHGLDRIDIDDTLQVFHAGTSRSVNGGYLTAGGRVLTVTAADETLQMALGRCYQTIQKIDWPGMQYRRDIGRFRERAEA